MLTLTRKGIQHELASTANASAADRWIKLHTQLAEDLAEATQKIDMLEGKIDVLKSQIELSSTVISSYQAVEETRIAIATADRVRALAEPQNEVMP